MRYLSWVPLLVVLAGEPAAADVIGVTNGSFENGLSGWTVTQSLGLVRFAPDGAGGVLTNVLRPAGTVSTSSAFTFVPNSPGVPQAVSALEDASIAVLDSAAAGTEFAFLPQHLDIFLSQSVTVAAGDVISGWSRFANGDFLEQDYGWVRVRDGAGALLATPWLEYSGSAGTFTWASHHRNNAPLHGMTNWMQWSWQASVSGTYDLQLGMSTFGDGAVSSYGLHDAVRVAEPSTLTLAFLGVAAGFVRRRKARGSAAASNGAVR